MGFKSIVLILFMLIGIFSASAQINCLTVAEKDWLFKYKDSIRVFVECNFPPFVYMDHDIAKGASIDLLKEMENDLGVSFHYYKCSNLKDIFEQIKKPGKNIVTSVKRTADREKFMSFSDFYFEIPVVIASRDGIDKILDFQKLGSYNIAVGNEYGVANYIKQNYPDYKLKLYENDYRCLQSLAFGNVDIAITDIASYSHITQTYNINNIKVSNVIPYSYNLAFGVTLGQDTLLNIVNKALSDINNAERDRILNNWVVLKVDKSNGYKAYLKYLVIVGVGILLLFTLIILWNYTLRKQIGRKTKLLNDELQRKIETEHKLIAVNEELLQAKGRAEESDRLKTAFLANMSHEIRTPMNGILGFAELLKEPDLIGDTQQEYVNIIERGGLRMLNIINNIIDISKIESGLMEVNAKESDINEQLEYVYSFFKPEVERKGLQLFLERTLLAEDAIITTDREMIYAVLTNLIKNAINYTNQGDVVFGCDKKDDHLLFYVKDSGIGIPKDRQQAIFERFIQADISNKQAFQGAGLGLTISKAYVELLGGRLWVESEEGVGTIFYFTIPYTFKPTEKKVIGDMVSSQNKTNQIKDLKILIAEDDETSEMLISITVTEFSKEIMKARTGHEAIEICITNPDLDLILMDIQMPDLNGHEATRQIRQFNKNVIILAQTAFGLAGDREKAIEAGCNDYISKPIRKEELLSLIHKYFPK